jgi:hypothetical protein
MTYPFVLSEDSTLDYAAAGFSIARFGDGELRLATGGGCVSQEADPKLAGELRTILSTPEKARPNGCLPCIPNVAAAPPHKAAGWATYADAKFTGLYARKARFGSSFVSRPDSAPWIDRPEYWDKVKSLWAGREVILVTGGGKAIARSLRVDALAADAADVTHLIAETHRDAYREVDDLEAIILRVVGEAPEDPALRKPVLMCLGATATVLAWRLAAKGVWALDLGHMGMFQRHAGSYAVVGDDLISPAYKEQLVRLRERRSWGGDGHKHADAVAAYAAEVKAETILDYGCGEATLCAALKAATPPRRVMNYDAGIPGKDAAPKPCDLVVSTDVLEHVEPEKLVTVLDHMFRIAAKAGYFVISTRPAKAILPDGRNAHLIVEPAEWWVEKVKAAGWTVERMEVPGKEVRLWLRK